MNNTLKYYYLKVNRSSVIPTDYANLEGWYDSQDESTLTLTGSLVDQWDDKSGNSNNFTSTGTNRPTYTAGSGIAYTNNFMQSGSAFNLTGEFTIMTVIDSSTVISGTRMYCGSSSTDEKFGTVSGSGNLFFRVVSSGDSSIAFPKGADELFIVTITRDSNDKVDVYIDSGSGNRLYSDAAQSGTTVLNRIGRDNATSSWAGRINEHIIYSRNLAESERSALITSLQNKYSIT